MEGQPNLLAGAVGGAFGPADLRPEGPLYFFDKTARRSWASGRAMREAGDETRVRNIGCILLVLTAGRFVRRSPPSRSSSGRITALIYRSRKGLKALGASSLFLPVHH